jgi:hypothetical protein
MAEKEYIERFKVMQICEAYSQHCFHVNDSHGQHIADGILDDVVAIPTADVVEVVRCKDCVFRKNRFCAIHSKYTPDTGYCSFAKEVGELQ